MARAFRCFALLGTFALAACGTTSNIKPETTTEAPTATQPAVAKIDLSSYDRVVVLDFSDATNTIGMKPDQVRAYSDTVATATRTFADLIAQKVRDGKAFHEVLRGPNSGAALVVSGRITRLVEGNSFARLMLPGAGMSHFEATTELTDAATGHVLGHLNTDNKSWALGGGIAASQSVQTFMNEAAEKIALQLKEQKQGSAVVQAK
jgi:Domain of unknown function (DUF4410)